MGKTDGWDLLRTDSDKKPHIFELWPHLSGRQPREVGLSIDETVYSTIDEFSKMSHGDIEVIRQYIDEINALWLQGLTANSDMESNLRPILRKISPDGRRLEAALSTYKISYWMKNRLSALPLDIQRQIANQFCFLNIGAVTVTSDNYVLLEQRREKVTAGGMLLSYPCGYLTQTDRTLEDSLVAQSVGELGFAVVQNGVLDSRVKSICSIGMQRESDEWSMNYVFRIKLKIPFSKVKPTKETKRIIGWHLDGLAERAVDAYSPTIKGEFSGKLVPNTVGMLGLYILAEQGTKAFDEFMTKIGIEAQKRGYKLQSVEYSPVYCPFR